jgi:hypothetical protein
MEQAACEIYNMAVGFKAGASLSWIVWLLAVAGVVWTVAYIAFAIHGAREDRRHG